MIETIFTVKNEDLERLSPQESVDIFRGLLWAEATSIGIGKNLINVPSAITIADGGIDAQVRDAPISDGQGIIKTGLTRYQIKTGEFSLQSNANIKKILLNDRATELKPRVKFCLDNNGTLVVVLFGWDNPEIRDDQIINEFKGILRGYDSNYTNAKIEIWRQNNIISFLQCFPSLILRVNGRDRAVFQTHKSWSSEAEMRSEFKSGQVQEELISKIQNELRKDANEASHIRIFGEPGIGKTKLILKATDIDDLRSSVVYCDTASKFMGSELMNEILMEHNKFTSILVIDECNQDSRSYIWNKLKYQGSRIKIISIYNEYDDTSGSIAYFDVPKLDNNQVSDIIQGYGILKDQAERWPEYCGGSPRVAHVIGQNLRNNPEDLLKNPDTVNVWDRFITGSDDPNIQIVRERTLVLQYVALFKKFGFGRPVNTEAQFIAKLIEQANPQITWPRFQEIIQELRSRKILQGEVTLYITPKLLHLKLWTDWWNTYGRNVELDDFYAKLTPQLREWFEEMFKYASESEITSRIVRDLLGTNGPFQNSDYIRTEEGSRFFLALAEANPEYAVRCLKNTIGTWSKDDLTQFTTGRRQVVFALEKIAMWRELFSDAARLLLMLGESENERLGNNASGVFADLFSPGPGHVAPSEASPQERFPILKEALESESKEKRLLALRACTEALKTGHFVRTIGDERQGLRREPALWSPKTWGEMFDSYRRVWNLLFDRLDDLPNDEQQKGVEILLQHIRGVGRIGNLADMVIDTIRQLARKPYVDKRKILVNVTLFLQYEVKEIPPEMLKRWEQIRDELTGQDFSSRMRRYVGISVWDIPGDDDEDKIPKNIKELAQEALENKQLLITELDWLMTEDAKESHTFGYMLGKLDQGFSILTELLTAQRKHTIDTSVYLLGGYLRALFESENEKWEETLDCIAEDEKLRVWLPEITWRSGTSDRASLRILRLAEKGDIDITQYRNQVYGGLGISEGVFIKWISYLIGHQDISAAYIALDWYHFYYIRRDASHELPEEITFQLLLHKSFSGKSEISVHRQLDDFHWTQIASEFIRLYPTRALNIANMMLEHFEEDGTIFQGHNPQTNEVLIEIAKKNPHEVWSMVTKYLGPPIDARAFKITHWLRGRDLKYHQYEKPPFTLFHLEDIWAWVDMDIEKRAWYLASFAPKELSKSKVCLAREILIRYGDRKDVRRNLISNFETGVFSGEASLHFQNLKEKLTAFRDTEDNENVGKWIEEYTELLVSHIEQWKIREEREF